MEQENLEQTIEQQTEEPVKQKKERVTKNMTYEEYKEYLKKRYAVTCDLCGHSCSKFNIDKHRNGKLCNNKQKGDYIPFKEDASAYMRKYRENYKSVCEFCGDSFYKPALKRHQNSRYCKKIQEIKNAKI